jgi:hypothetical protein
MQRAVNTIENWVFSRSFAYCWATDVFSMKRTSKNEAGVLLCFDMSVGMSFGDTIFLLLYR